MLISTVKYKRTRYTLAYPTHRLLLFEKSKELQWLVFCFLLAHIYITFTSYNTYSRGFTCSEGRRLILDRLPPSKLDESNVYSQTVLTNKASDTLPRSLPLPIIYLFSKMQQILGSIKSRKPITTSIFDTFYPSPFGHKKSYDYPHSLAPYLDISNHLERKRFYFLAWNKLLSILTEDRLN